MIYNNIKELTKENSDFRRVLCTGTYSQIVLMSLLPGEEIGEEMNSTCDQIIVIVDGEGKAVIADEICFLEDHATLFIPAGVKHNVINTDDEELKFYTIYSPPLYLQGDIQHTHVHLT